MNADPAYQPDADDPAGMADAVVVYQGVRGAFSEQAARLLMSRIDLATVDPRFASRSDTRFESRCGSTFEPRFVGVPSLDVVRVALERGRAGLAVVPVRNSIAGDVPGADAIVRLAGARIVSDIAMPVVQCLVAPRGVTLRTLRRVVSHPMAIAQCRRFLSSHPTLQIEAHEDTAGALEMLISVGATDAAAIASARAAEIWGGVILQHAIQDDKDNLTTFVLLGTGVFSTETGPSGTGLIHIPE